MNRGCATRLTMLEVHLGASGRRNVSLHRRAFGGPLQKRSDRASPALRNGSVQSAAAYRLTISPEHLSEQLLKSNHFEQFELSD